MILVGFAILETRVFIVFCSFSVFMREVEFFGIWFRDLMYRVCHDTRGVPGPVTRAPGAPCKFSRGLRVCLGRNGHSCRFLLKSKILPGCRSTDALGDGRPGGRPVACMTVDRHLPVNVVFDVCTSVDRPGMHRSTVRSTAMQAVG